MSQGFGGSRPNVSGDTTVGVLTRSPVLREQVVEVLRGMIVRGVLAPGARINEVEVAATLGISRGPLREALQRLDGEGLLEMRPNRGAFVRSINREEVQQMYEVRELVESKAAMLTAVNATDADIARLRDVLAETDELLAADPRHSYPEQLDIHQLVLELAGNPFLQRFGTDLQLQVRLARLKSGSSPERARQALVEHRSIIEAIAARSPRAAGQAMTIHLRNSMLNLLSIDDETSTGQP